MDLSGILQAFLTVAGTIFIAELTDKDALLLLSLATKTRPWLVFAAGSVAFTITSAIIVLVGSALVVYFPIFWIKIAGGSIMLAYALWEYWKGLQEEKDLGAGGERLAKNLRRGRLYAFVAMLASLIILDLAGDATELVTVVFVAQFRDILLVFAGAVAALVAASAVETILGNRLGRVLSASKIRYLSIIVFLIIGSVIIVSTVLGL